MRGCVFPTVRMTLLSAVGEATLRDSTTGTKKRTSQLSTKDFHRREIYNILLSLLELLDLNSLIGPG